jgi:phosphatidate cytidylyltransferase
MQSNMFRRVMFAVIAIPLLVAVVWLGGWPLAAVLAVATMLGTTELLDLAAVQGIRPFRETGRVVAVAVPLGLGAALAGPAAHDLVERWWVFAALGVVIWVLGLAVATRGPGDRPLAAAAVTLLTILYATVLPASLFFIRHAAWSTRSFAGTAVVFFPLVVTWMCDTAAMLGGQAIGGPKLSPVISPGKTRSGAIAGVIGGVAVGVLYAAVVFTRTGIPIGIVSAALLALVLTVVGQVGDLAESLLKREAGVKDSSAIIPGHGGVLDRLDSLYFVIPVAAAGYRLLGLF